MNYNLNEVLKGILSIYFNEPQGMPTFEKLKVADIAFTPKEITAYEGTYTSKDIPLALTIRYDEGNWTGQATGQSSFPLSTASKTMFFFEATGIVIRFLRDDEDDDDTRLILEQGGVKYHFDKED